MGSTLNYAQQRIQSIKYKCKARVILRHPFCPHSAPRVFSKDNLTFGRILPSSSRVNFQAVVIIRKGKTMKNSLVGSTSPKNQEAQWTHRAGRSGDLLLFPFPPPRPSNLPAHSDPSSRKGKQQSSPGNPSLFII